MEYLTDKKYEDVKILISETLHNVLDQVEKLKTAPDIQQLRMMIRSSAEVSPYLTVLKKLIDSNVPGTLVLVDDILDNEDLPVLERLQFLHLRYKAVLSSESFKKAEKVAEDACELSKLAYEKHLEETAGVEKSETPSVVAVLRIQALFDCFQLLLMQENLAKAKGYLDEAIEVARESNCSRALFIGQLLYADWLISSGRPDEAVENVLQPLLTCKEVWQTDRRRLYLTLGNAYSDCGQWSQAQQCYQMAQLLSKPIVPSTMTATALAQQKFQQLSSTTSTSKTSSGEMQKAVANSSSAQKPTEKFGSQSSLQSTSSETQKIASDEDVIHHIQRSHVEKIGISKNDILISTGQVAAALKKQEKTLDFAVRKGDLWILAQTFEQMGSSHSIRPRGDRKNMKASLVYACLEYELAKKLEHQARLCWSMANIGVRFIVLLDQESAINLLEKTVSMCQSMGYLRTESRALAGLGKALVLRGRLQEGIECLQRALELSGKYGKNEDVAHDLRELTQAYYLSQNSSLAYETVKRCLLAQETLAAELETTDIARLSNFEQNQLDTYRLFQTVVIKLGKFKEALSYCEYGRGRLIKEIVRSKHMKGEEDPEIWDEKTLLNSNFDESISDRMCKEFEQTADELNTSLVVYAIASELGPEGKPVKYFYIWLILCESHMNEKHNGERIHFRKSSLNDAKEELKIMDEARFFTSLLRSFQEMNLTTETVSNDLQASGENTGSKEGTKFSENLFQKINLFHDSDDESEDELENPSENVRLNENLEESRELDGNKSAKTQSKRKLLLPQWDDHGKRQLKTLYRVCIAPLEDILPIGTKEEAPRLTIIPQDFLYSVPFCALLDNEDRYLVQRYIISYVPSLRTLQLFHKRLRHLRSEQGERGRKALLLGNPEFRQELTPLDSSGVEVNLIQHILGDGCKTATRYAATKELFLAGLRENDIIHVASHARPDDPGITYKTHVEKYGDYDMRGCIVLSPSSSKCNGLVLATEIAESFSSCQLVTLSCCETGLGKLTGDGVLGLYRALFVAGTAGIVATLWRISDDLTPIFMEKFYESFVALLLGNPEFEEELTPLDSSGVEVNLIQRILGDGCKTATRYAATKELFLAGLQENDIIHVASHARPDDPGITYASDLLKLFFNFIYKTRVEKNGDYDMRGCISSLPSSKCNRLVLAIEIAESFSSCQLVILNCCETGLRN